MKQCKLQRWYKQVCQHRSRRTVCRFYSGQHHASRPEMKAPFQDLDPFHYTTGRWLRNDAAEHKSRYIHFDFRALCEKMLRLCPGAATITACEKKEGGFNRAFIFTFDNGRRTVARMPFAVAGPPKLTTNSEVTTIRFLQANTSIPIPRILEWSDNAASDIGCEYIIMEHAKGVQLQQRWPSMTGDQKVRFIIAIYEKMKEMVSMDFRAYGSLYSSKVTSNSIFISPGVYIGPYCSPIYRSHAVEAASLKNDSRVFHGPYSSLGDFADGLIKTGVSRLPLSHNLPSEFPIYQGAPSEHSSILQAAQAVLRHLVEDESVRKAGVPTLFHPDLHLRNIFVSEDDPTIIEDVIDWQSCSIEPAFWYTDELPDFAGTQVGDLCRRAFEISVVQHFPRLAQAWQVNESKLRPFRYSYRTWTDGLVALRQELIDISREWEELGLDGKCPFSKLTQDELAAHERSFRIFVAEKELRRDLASLVDCATDGWIPTDQWESANLTQKQLFDDMLHAVVNNSDVNDDEPIRTERDLRAIWPYDLM